MAKTRAARIKPQFVNPYSVSGPCHGRMCYTLHLHSINEYGHKTTIDLSPVIDLSWSRAAELRTILEEFLAKEANIQLHTATQVREELETRKVHVLNLEGEIEFEKRRIAQLEAFNEKVKAAKKK